MKKLLVILALFYLLPAMSQQNEAIPEPEFIGEVYIANIERAQYRLLPKERASRRVVNVFNSVTTRLILEERQSPFEVGDNMDYVVIIKAEDNTRDPRSLFQIFKFGINFSDERFVELGSGTVGGNFNQSETNTKSFIPFTAKKFGDSSYVLSFDISPGEYGIISDSYDDTFQIISTFSVFDYKEREQQRLLIEQKELQAQIRRDKKAAKRSNNK